MTRSDDLDNKLRDALLESLASWDPRASVPLALSFMAHGAWRMAMLRHWRGLIGLCGRVRVLG